MLGRRDAPDDGAAPVTYDRGPVNEPVAVVGEEPPALQEGPVHRAFHDAVPLVGEGVRVLVHGEFRLNIWRRGHAGLLRDSR